MRILFLDQFSDPGGAQQVLLDLLPAISERGWEALVGMPGEGDLFRRVREMGIETVQVECGPYTSGRKSAADAARFLAGTPRLARQIRRLTADIVYVNGPRLLPAVALARMTAPVLFHSHSYIPPGASRRIAGASLRRTNAHVVANCRFVAEQWRP